MSTLVRHGILSGLRGKGGGYCLTREPDQFTVGEVLRLTEGSLSPVSCLSEEHNTCERAATCRTIHVWRELDHLIEDYLEGVTIADLMCAHPEAEE